MSFGNSTFGTTPFGDSGGVLPKFSLDDVNTNETTVDGEVGVTLTLSEAPTLDSFAIQTVGGLHSLSGSNITGSNNSFTVDLFDVANGAYPSFDGLPFSSVNWNLEYIASLGVDSSTLAATHNPAAGWAIVDVVSARATAGSIFEGRTGLPNDTSQVYYPTAGNTTIDPDGTIFTDLTSVAGRMFNSDTGTEESWHFVVA